MKNNHNTQQTRWKHYRYCCFCFTNGTGITGKINFEKPVDPDIARARVRHELTEAIVQPGIDFIFDPDNHIILIKPKGIQYL